MIWIIITAVFLLLVVAIIYGVGSFIPHTTNMCVVDVERNIAQCFALATKPELYAKYLPHIQKIEFDSGHFSEKGSRGKLITKSSQYPFEVTEFIPNYRVAVRHEGASQAWKLQLSFYKLSLNSARLVLIATVETESKFGRSVNAFLKKSQMRFFNEMLQHAKKCVENEPEVEETFPDVSPEENPNFTL